MDWSALIKILPQLGAAAVVALAIGGLFFYVLRYTIPAMQKDAETQRKEFHSTMQKALDLNIQQAKDFHSSLQSIQQTMLQQQTGFLLALTEERSAHTTANVTMVAKLDLLREEIRLQTSSIVGALKDRK